MPFSILITDATGRTGRSLMGELMSRDIPFRTMSRRPGAIEKSWGVDPYVGDWDDRASLANALHGIQYVYLHMPPHPKTGEWTRGFLEEARAADVRHIVRFSALGAAPEAKSILLRRHAEAEELIRRSGIGYTFLHAQLLAESLIDDHGRLRDRDEINYPYDDDARVAPVSADDVAAVAAAVLTDERHIGHTYYLTGPEAMTYHDIARTFGEVRGRPVRYVRVSPERAREDMLRRGEPEWLVDGRCDLHHDWKTRSNLVTDDVERICNRPPKTLRVVLEEHQEELTAGEPVDKNQRRH